MHKKDIVITAVIAGILLLATPACDLPPGTLAPFTVILPLIPKQTYTTPPATEPPLLAPPPPHLHLLALPPLHLLHRHPRR